MGGGVRLLGLAPVKQVPAEALAAHSGGQFLNLSPRYTLGGALVLVGLQHGGMKVAAEQQGLRVGLAGDAEGAVFGFGQVGVGNEG